MSEPEQITPHLTITWFYDHALAMFSVYDVNRKTIDAWADTVIELTEQKLGQGEPVRWIHNAETIAFPATPYIKQRSEDIQLAHPHANGSAAIVLAKNPICYIIGQSIIYLGQSRQLDVAHQVFYSVADALQWQESFLNK